jgi:hypothetical protein
VPPLHGGRIDDITGTTSAAAGTAGTTAYSSTLTGYLTKLFSRKPYGYFSFSSPALEKVRAVTHSRVSDELRGPYILVPGLFRSTSLEYVLVN